MIGSGFAEQVGICSLPADDGVVDFILEEVPTSPLHSGIHL
jgi:hypothetical protein